MGKLVRSDLVYNKKVKDLNKQPQTTPDNNIVQNIIGWDVNFWLDLGILL